jgi:peptide/nickel transport system substrate-binding protein
LNTTIAPLSNLSVRKAIIAASDRDGLLLTQGGKVAGSLANGYIPPTDPSFGYAGGFRQNTDLKFMRYPHGNVALAMKYMLAARAQGVANINAAGVYTGPKLLTIASNVAPASDTALAAQGQLAKLGIHLRLVFADPAALFTQYCDVPKQHVAICAGAGFSEDYADPEPLLTALFDGNSIVPQGNVNWSLLDDRRVDAAIDKAVPLPVGSERYKAWARINHMIAADAPGIPYLWPSMGQIASKNVNLVVNSYYQTADLNFTSLR